MPRRDGGWAKSRVGARLPPEAGSLERVGSAVWAYRGRMAHAPLAAWREKFHAVLQTESQRHLNWPLRRDFYLDLGDDEFARRFRGWMAVLSAQRVLPILMQFTPYEPQPFKEIDACIRVLRGMELPEDVAIIVDEGYHWRGMDLGEDLVTGETLLNVGLASMAAHKALLEVQGWPNPFEYAVRPGTPELEWPDDEFFAKVVAVGDAAGCAAMAAGCSTTSFARDPERVGAFWTWWLDVAWPQAEQYAGLGQDMYWQLFQIDPDLTAGEGI